jgi:hypothetical protein
MKTKLAIVGSLAVVGAGIWYLVFRNQSFTSKEETGPVGPVRHDDDDAHNHIRKVLRKAKLNAVVPGEDDAAFISG